MKRLILCPIFFLLACSPPTPSDESSDGLFPKNILNLCLDDGSAPQIVSSTIMHPQALLAAGSAPANWNPTDGRLSVGGVEYVASDSMRFELVIDKCAQLSNVT